MNANQIYEQIKQIAFEKGSNSINYSNLMTLCRNSTIASGHSWDSTTFSAALVKLQAEDKIKLERFNQTGEIVKVVCVHYFEEKLKKIYADMEENNSIPFPAPDVFGVPCPASLIQKIDVKTEFVRLLEGNLAVTRPILQLQFKEFDHPILVFKDMLEYELLKFCVEKIQYFFKNENNYEYMNSKLNAALVNEQSGVALMLSMIVKKPAEAVESLRKTNSFTFKFWTVLAGTIVKEFGARHATGATDFVFAQAAFLLGYYTVYCKGCFQKETAIEVCRIDLMKALTKSPYLFTVAQIMEFKDSKENLLYKKVGRETYESFIRELLTSDDKNPPRLMTVKNAHRQEVFILYNAIPFYLEENLKIIRKDMYETLRRKWINDLDHCEWLPEMDDDKVFENLMKKYLIDHYADFYALLNYNLLSQVQKFPGMGDKQKAIIMLYLDEINHQILPLSRLFNITRKGLFSDARVMVSVWKSNKILRVFALFFKQLFMTGAARKAMKEDRKRKRNKNQKEFQKISDTGALNESISLLKEHFLAPGMTVEAELENLIDRWNPLIDAVAKRNLVEDVNSFIRDYVRKLKRSFITNPPNRERVENIAESLSNTQAFDAIKEKEALRQYMFDRLPILFEMLSIL